MADDSSRLEGGVEWVTIHNPDTGGEAEITRASWDEPTDERAEYLSFADRGFKLGRLPKRASRAESTKTEVTA